MDMLTANILHCALAYLIGSIPFGLLLVKWAGRGDIRKVGSGNIGTTNAFRAGGKKLGIATLMLDVGKGVFAVWLPEYLWDNSTAAHLAMLCVIVGHCYPVWLKFKGGKGVATAAGAILTFYHYVWPYSVTTIMLPLAAIWVSVFIASRTVSLASLVTVACLPLVTYYMSGMFIEEVAIAVLIIYKHRDNITRLRRGEEHRFVLWHKKKDNTA